MVAAARSRASATRVTLMQARRVPMAVPRVPTLRTASPDRSRAARPANRPRGTCVRLHRSRAPLAIPRARHAATIGLVLQEHGTRRDSDVRPFPLDIVLRSNRMVCLARPTSTYRRAVIAHTLVTHCAAAPARGLQECWGAHAVRRIGCVSLPRAHQVVRRSFQISERLARRRVPSAHMPIRAMWTERLSFAGPGFGTSEPPIAQPRPSSINVIATLSLQRL